MARWQIVVKKSEASKPTKTQLIVQGTTLFSVNGALELCDSWGGRPGVTVEVDVQVDSWGGRPGLLVPQGFEYGLCGRKATLNFSFSVKGCWSCDS